jgi:hypothetical protein
LRYHRKVFIEPEQQIKSIPFNVQMKKTTGMHHGIGSSASIIETGVFRTAYDSFQFCCTFIQAVVAIAVIKSLYPMKEPQVV